MPSSPATTDSRNRLRRTVGVTRAAAVFSDCANTQQVGAQVVRDVDTLKRVRWWTGLEQEQVVKSVATRENDFMQGEGASCQGAFAHVCFRLPAPVADLRGNHPDCRSRPVAGTVGTGLRSVWSEVLGNR